MSLLLPKADDRNGMTPSPVDHNIAKAPIFHGVESSAVSAFIDLLQPIHFARRSTIFVQGDPGDRLYIITGGKVKIGRQSADGRQNLLTILGPLDLFGELSVLDPGPRTSTATAVTAVEAAWLDRKAFLAWVADWPGTSDCLLQGVARRVRRTHHEVAEFACADVSGRVARQVLKLAERFGTPEGRIIHVRHDLTQEEIAQLAGASREAVNKALSEFVAHGWISVHGKTLLIERQNALHRRASLSSATVVRAGGPSFRLVRFVLLTQLVL